MRHLIKERMIIISYSKYSNKKTVIDGIVFDSMREAERYTELKILEKAKEISELQLQVPFMLIEAQYAPDTVTKRGKVKKGKCLEQACKYFADFVYKNTAGEMIVEDVKGKRTKEYIIKRKLMLERYGIHITEV